MTLTVCPRRRDPFNIVSYYIKWVTTSWTHSICILKMWIRNTGCIERASGPINGTFTIRTRRFSGSRTNRMICIHSFVSLCYLFYWVTKNTLHTCAENHLFLEEEKIKFDNFWLLSRLNATSDPVHLIHLTQNQYCWNSDWEVTQNSFKENMFILFC